MVVVVVAGGGVGRKNGGGRRISCLGGAAGEPPPPITDPNIGNRRELSPAEAGPPPPEFNVGFLSGFDVLPPAPPLPLPKIDPRAGANTGKSAAAAVPAPLLPVAAVRSCGAIFKSNDVKSPDPPPELDGLEGCLKGGFLGGGFDVTGFLTSTLLLLSPSL